MLQLPLPFFKNRAEKGDAYEKFLLDTNCSVAQRYHHHHNFKKEKIIMKKQFIVLHHRPAISAPKPDSICAIREAISIFLTV